MDVGPDETNEPNEVPGDPPADPQDSRHPDTDHFVVDQPHGVLEMSRSLIAEIIRREVAATDDVFGLAGGLWDQVCSIFSRRHIPRTIQITRDGNDLVVELKLSVRYGTDIRAKASEVRDRVIHAVQSMTGCPVKAVNVSIDRIGSPPKEPHKTNPEDDSPPDQA